MLFASKHAKGMSLRYNAILILRFRIIRFLKIGFSPKASGFYPFGDATALAGEVGVGDVVWLIQATASNHKPKGRFFWFVYAKGIPKEPSLWFVVYVV